jgi:hypothetical protein
MLITAFFNDVNSLPTTGLTPTVKIYDLESSTVVVAAGTMTEVSLTNVPGWYKYDFTTINLSHAYIAVIDGGSGLTQYYRYQNGILAPLLPATPEVEFGS